MRVPPPRSFEASATARLFGVLLAILALAAGSSPGVAQATGEARPGVPHALLEAIDRYTGVAGRVDDARAREIVTDLAARGFPLGVMWLARAHSTGRMGIPEDPARARALAGSIVGAVADLAEAGEPEAEFLMGTAWAEGLGRPRDPEAAVRWYRRAAEQGHVLAAHNLGNAYASGTGVPSSDSLAVAWWTVAARAGDAITQLRLGESYERGRGAEADLDRARRWYRAASERGNADAEAALRRLGSTPPRANALP